MNPRYYYPSYCSGPSLAECRKLENKRQKIGLELISRGLRPDSNQFFREMKKRMK